MLFTIMLLSALVGLGGAFTLGFEIGRARVKRDPNRELDSLRNSADGCQEDADGWSEDDKNY